MVLLSYYHSNQRLTSSPRIRQLITPVLLSLLCLPSQIPVFVSFLLTLSNSFTDTYSLFFPRSFVPACLSFSLTSLSLFQEFFRNLNHWMDQHAAMNDAGNFLIETCDETISLDLKQQLLLLNGRWRDLFLRVKQVTMKTFQFQLLIIYLCRFFYDHVTESLNKFYK